MSDPSVSQVRQWLRNGHVLTDAAASIDSAVDAFDGEMNAITRNVDRAMDSWKGDAAKASEAKADAEKQSSNRLAVTILDIADDLNRLGPTFIAACQSAVQKADEITSKGYALGDNGTVAAPDVATEGFPADVPLVLQMAEAQKAANRNAGIFQASMTELLKAVGAADAELAGQIRQTLGELGRNAARATEKVPVGPDVQAILDGRAALPTDPRKLNEFWDSLTAAEKAELWNHDREIGNKDGIPAADRDHFNRRRLVELQGDERRRIDELRRQHPEWRDGPPDRPGPQVGPDPKTKAAYDKWKDELDARQHRLDGYNNIESSLKGEPPRFLLLNSTEGRAAIAVGNPDTARNVATYVPGTGSNTTNISGGVDRAQAMREAAVDADPRSSTSVIAWYGYDAPQDFGAAAGPASAAGAAVPLDEFQTGLRATHEGATPSHNTVLGHSYGTVVVGEAASEGHTLDADDVVFVASPGVGGPDHPSELSLTGVDPSDNADRVWATTGQYDPIKLTEGVHGPSPNSPNFGGHRFSSDSERGDWYKLGWNPSAHSSYWDDDNVALENMGKIIVDREDTK